MRILAMRISDQGCGRHASKGKSRGGFVSYANAARRSRLGYAVRSGSFLNVFGAAPVKLCDDRCDLMLGTDVLEGSVSPPR